MSMSQFQQPFGQPGTYVQPHRGTLILVLGILGIVLCAVLAPFAWMMGNTDLREMAAGRMDRSGEGLVQAGRICGIIGTVLLIVSVLIVCLYFAVIIFFVGMVGAAGAGGAGGGGGF